MSKLRKHFITVLAVLFCVLLALSAVHIIPKTEKRVAQAASLNSAISDKFKVLEDDIWTSDAVNGGEFNLDNLKKLYAMLTGKNTATFNDVEKLGVKNAEDFRKLSTSDGKNLSIKFHGYHWTAAGLNRTRSGEVILTLWLTDYLELPNAYQSSRYSAYAEHTTVKEEWPSNVYSVSVLRTQGLNIGGYYFKDKVVSNNNSSTFEYVTQSVNHPLAPFTMKKGDYPDSVIEYLVTPANVAYQQNECACDWGGTTMYPNEGYGPYTSTELSGGRWPDTATARLYDNYTRLSFTNYNGSVTVKYDSWKDDYIWEPCESEIGYGNTNGGIWGLDMNAKTSGYDDAAANTWLRSGGTSTQNGRFLLCKDPNIGTYHRGDCMGASATDSLKVRPALHLNLTQAAFKAGGISFGNSNTTVSSDGKTATAKHTYNGKDYKLEIPDYDKLDVDFSSLPNTAKYDKDSGEFTVKLPNGSDSENYEISVTPKKDYYWGDAKTVEEGKKQRKYAIHVNKATIETDWKDFSVKYGGSLLRTTEPESKTVKDISVDFDVEYCITYAEKGTPQEPSVKNWKSEAELETKTATATGKYRVDYKIDDYVDGTNHYHSTLYGSYIVTVNSDTVTISLKGDGVIGSAKYGDAATNLTNQKWLNEQFAQRVTLSGTSGSYDGESSVLEFLNKEGLSVVLLKDSGSGKAPATKNDYDRFDAGTYYLGLSESGSIAFEWDTDGVEKYPSYEIKQKEIKVYIVDGSGGDNLTHIYGNSPAALKYDVDDDTFKKEINDKFSNTFTITDIIKCDTALDDYTLSNKTPVGTFMIEGSANGNSNFDVLFDDTEYTVGKRPVTLQVADETVEYGTDFSTYKFTNMTVADGSLATWDKPSTLSTEYYLIINGGEVNLSSTLAIGDDYQLWARVDNNNYDFTINKGKLKITLANFNMKGVTLANKGYVYDGNPHPAEISGTLPDGVSVTYRYVNMADGSESMEAPIEIGLYLVYASFKHNSLNHNPITDKAAYIRIAATAEEANQFPNLPTPEEIEAAAQLAKKKAEEKAALEEVAKAKKEEIAALEISDEEKAKANSDIDKELADGNAAIDSAKDASGAEQAFGEAKKKIEDISAACKAAEELAKKEAAERAELESKKSAAKEELDKAAQAKKDAIDNNPELTDEEKAAAKAEVDKQLEEGKKAIDGANSIDGVSSAESSTKTNIENIKAVHKGSFPWWILAVAVGVLLLAVVVIIVIKKRQTADGDDDFYDEDYDFDDEDFEEEDFDDFE